ncbi:hypothetical protein ACOSP7_021708 [Xanthoceras sorbifolium]
MGVSLEALAMADVEYVEWGMDIEEWEHEDSLRPPSPHLLADHDDGVLEECYDNQRIMKCLKWSIYTTAKAIVKLFMIVKLDLRRIY